MVALNQKLESLMSQVVTGLGFVWVGCEWANENGHQILRVYIDTDHGVTIDQCASVSRELSAQLETEDVSVGRYRLEVSSPGIERPLFRPEHYVSHVGQCISLRLRVPDPTGRRRFKGVVLSTNETGILLDLDDGAGEVNLLYAQIEKAKLVVDI